MRGIGKAAAVWAALALGAVLGWVGGAWSGSHETLTLPLLDVSTAPPSRLSSGPADSVPPQSSDRTETAPAPSSNHGQSVRAVIDRELPHATADEKDIWFEQLKELPPGIVEDLLSVRKQFRQMVPPLSPTELPAPLSLLPPQSVLGPQAVDPAWQVSGAALEQVRQITLHNLANANTPGYRRRDPRLEANAEGRGLEFVGIRLDLRNGTIRPTNRLADVALEGIGWFAVETGESLAVTRHGAFAVRNGRLALPIAGGQFAPVVPPIVVSEQIHRIDVASDGQVGGWTEGATTPQSLGVLKIALLSDAGLEAFEASQPIPRDAVSLHQPGVAGTASLVTRSLEQSNVNIDEETDRLRWIDNWLATVGLASMTRTVAPPLPR